MLNLILCRISTGLKDEERLKGKTRIRVRIFLGAFYSSHPIMLKKWRDENNRRVAQSKRDGVFSRLYYYSVSFISIVRVFFALIRKR